MVRTFTADVSRISLPEPETSVHLSVHDLIEKATKKPRDRIALRTFLAIELMAGHIHISSSPARASTVCYRFADDLIALLMSQV